MRESYRRVFKNPATLREMLDKYIAGAPPVQLAREYACDHSVITFHAKRAGVFVSRLPQRKTVSAEEKVIPPLWDTIDHIWRCCGGRTIGRHRKDCTGVEQSWIRSYYLNKTPTKYKYQHLFEDKICEGKSYAEYIADNQKRRMMHLKCSSKAAAYGVPLPQKISHPFDIRMATDPIARTASENRSIAQRTHHAIFSETTESQSLDSEPELLLLED